eukprot:scaffold106434_cov21-Tisochrysis_lutea.AAC.2
MALSTPRKMNLSAKTQMRALTRPHPLLYILFRQHHPPTIHGSPRSIIRGTLSQSHCDKDITLSCQPKQSAPT